MEQNEMMEVNGGGSGASWMWYATSIVGSKYGVYGTVATAVVDGLVLRSQTPHTIVHHDRGNTYTVRYAGKINGNGSYCRRKK